MNRRFRVDLVSEHASPLASLGGHDAGGQNVHVAALATELGRQGCQVRVFTRLDSPQLPTSVELAPGATVEHLPAGPPEPLPKDELFGHMPEFADRLAARWHADPPDAAHAHFWMSGWAALQAAADRVRVVQTFHALGVVKTRHQGAADASPPERGQVEAEVLAGVDHVVATCSDEVTELMALGADQGKVTVVPCGIDPKAFRPAGPRLQEPPVPGRRARRYRLVTVSRLVPRKGIDDVIRALADVPEAELVVAGGPAGPALDSDPEARRLRAVARHCDVDDRVTLLGGLPRSVVPSLLRSADLVVATPWYEPFGIVPIEAMACGVPVVATAVGGQLDTVRPERTGLLVEAHDPDGIAAAVRRLLANPSLRHRMGEEAAAVARERYTWGQVARSTFGVYEQIARTPDAGRRKVPA